MTEPIELPTDGDRRRTRIVFPSGREARIWKLLTIIATAWAAWFTARLEQNFGAHVVLHETQEWSCALVHTTPVVGGNSAPEQAKGK